MPTDNIKDLPETITLKITYNSASIYPCPHEIRNITVICRYTINKDFKPFYIAADKDDDYGWRNFEIIKPQEIKKYQNAGYNVFKVLAEYIFKEDIGENEVECNEIVWLIYDIETREQFFVEAAFEYADSKDIGSILKPLSVEIIEQKYITDEN